MVVLRIVEPTKKTAENEPIGILRALTTGFDRVTAQPALLLPPILIDLLLWFGPRVRIEALIRSWTAQMFDPAIIDPMLVEQAKAVQGIMDELAVRLSLIVGLSPAPGGIPSLMAGRLPLTSPAGSVPVFEITTVGGAAGFALAMLVVGLGIGALFNRAVASQIRVDAPLPSIWRIWLRFGLLLLTLYVGAAVITLGVLLVAAVASLITPMLSFFLAAGALGLVFWVAIYLSFTPHGIVGYGFGVLRAMMQSVLLVRVNLLAALGFLASVFLITAGANLIWTMPREDSWFTALAVLGHAFVSATLLAGSYAFYIGRTEWMTSRRALRPVPTPPAADSD
jgi:hypothetical protein